MTLSDHTCDLLGEDELALMKLMSERVNISRGLLVDEEALIEALQQQRRAGSVLNIFATEPLPTDHPLRTLPNVVATGHIGFVTEASYRVFYQDTVQCLVNWLDGQSR